jgi:hypothetical protein
MSAVREYFLAGTFIGLGGALVEISVTPAPYDSLALLVSTVCFVIAVLNGNSMMKILSKTYAD